MNILPVYPHFMTRSEIPAKCGALRDIMEREFDNLYIFVVVLINEDTHASVSPKRIVNYFPNTKNIHYRQNLGGEELSVVSADYLGNISHNPSFKTVLCTITNLEKCVESLFKTRDTPASTVNEDLEILSGLIEEGKI